MNERVLVEDCHYGFCHGCLTCGSDSVHNKNILVRRLQVDHARNLLWLKMRPDTPQHYEYVTMENVTGSIESFLNIKPWTQFYDLKDRKDIPLSYADHITVKDCTCDCKHAFDVDSEPSQYQLTDFAFYGLNIRTEDKETLPDVLRDAVLENCTVTKM